MTRKVAVHKRVTDIPPIYSVYWQLQNGEIVVCCPKCGKEARIHKDGEDKFRLTCMFCRYQEIRPAAVRAKAAQGYCSKCGRWIHSRLPEENLHYPSTRTACPYCGAMQNLPVFSTGGTVCLNPMRGLVYYYQTTCRGRLVWALNRDHLEYLLSYLEADLREKYRYFTGPDSFAVMANGQAQFLPGWMKKAKNHREMVKVLTRLREK